jgi:hypothetical protein
MTLFWQWILLEELFLLRDILSPLEEALENPIEASRTNCWPQQHHPNSLIMGLRAYGVLGFSTNFLFYFIFIFIVLVV